MAYQYHPLRGVRQHAVGPQGLVEAAVAQAESCLPQGPILKEDWMLTFPPKLSLPQTQGFTIQRPHSLVSGGRTRSCGR